MASPLLGSGIVPQSGAVADQLSDVVRRAFVPRLVVQTYKATPLLSAMIANAQDADGGISSVTVPVQGSPLVSHQWSGYSGSFNQPTQPTGIQDANFNLALSILPVPVFSMESALQLNHAVVNLLKARMNDASNVAADAWATALYGNTTNDQAIIGLPGAVDDGTTLNTYGGINRTTYPFWKSKLYSAGAVNPTRNLMLQYIAGITKNSGGERPDFAVTGMGTWALLAQDFTSLERYEVSSAGSYADSNRGARALFTALMVADVPVFADPYCPEGTMYLLNMKYISAYMHRAARFAFTGFASMLPNLQLGYLGAVITLLLLANSKPSASGAVTGFNSLTL